MFISEKNKIANIEMISYGYSTPTHSSRVTITPGPNVTFPYGKLWWWRTTVTSVLTGIHSFDYNKENDTLIYSVYFDNAWDIHSLKEPLYDLEYTQHTPADTISFDNDFHEIFNTEEYILHGRKIENKSRNRRQTTHPDNQETPEPPRPASFEDFSNYYRRSRGEVSEDSLRVNFYNYLSRNFRLDQRPDSTNFSPPIIKNYKPRFQIDSFWGGVAYSSAFGTLGMLQLGLRYAG